MALKEHIDHANFMEEVSDSEQIWRTGIEHFNKLFEIGLQENSKGIKYKNGGFSPSRAPNQPLKFQNRPITTIRLNHPRPSHIAAKLNQNLIKSRLTYTHLSPARHSKIISLGRIPNVKKIKESRGGVAEVSSESSGR